MVKGNPICVVGMHRSGTSLITRTLNYLGVFLGPEEHLMKPLPDNPKGFWEHQLLTDLNDDILARLGGNLYDPPTFRSGWESSSAFADLRQLGRALIEKEFGAAELWGWKDPRNSLTLPFWRHLIPNMRYLVCVRNPVDVVRSLERRDKFSFEKGASLWFEYMKSAVVNTAGEPRLFISYEEIMADWKSPLPRLASFIGRPEAADSAEIQNEVKAFVDAELQHFVTSVVDAIDEPKLPFPTKALYLLLQQHITQYRASAPGKEGDEQGFENLIDPFTFCASEAQADAELVHRKLDDQEKQLAIKEQTVATLQSHLAERETTGQMSEAELKALRTQYHSDKQRFAEESAANTTALDDLVRQKDEVTRALLEVREQLQETQTRLQNRDNSAQIMSASLDTRLTQLESEIRGLAGQVAFLTPRMEHLQLQLAAHTAPRTPANPDVPGNGVEPKQPGRQLEQAYADLRIVKNNLKFTESALASERRARQLLETSITSIYTDALAQIREFVRAATPPDATVLVVSKGDNALLKLDGRHSWHFPRGHQGVYAGCYPADSAEAVAHLESLIAQGAEFLVFPNAAFWWLEYYGGFREYLDENHSRVLANGTCIIFELSRRTGRESSPLVRDKAAIGWSSTRNQAADSPAMSQAHPACDALSSSSTSDPNDNGSSLGTQARLPGGGEHKIRVDEHRVSDHAGTTLFDPAWYMRQLPPGGTAGREAWDHYLSIGAEERRDPHPLFDTQWYLQRCPEAGSMGISPLEHYLDQGAREGRSPHPLFDPIWYWKSYPETVLTCLDPLQHYLNEGWRKGYQPNPKFDPLFYLATYPDVAAAGIEPLTHFIIAGLKEGRIGCAEDLPIEPFEADFQIPREPMPSEPLPNPLAKAITFYLPQFHPIPQNDLWWGTGFTEWMNVRRGIPQFEGHYQPHVPGCLDYYDLRNPDVLEAQAQLARDSGLYGFAFYYYWFDGTVLLDLPIRRILDTGRPDFPFCICWANENWTRSWDGRERDILIAQNHSAEDDLAFIRNIEPILLHRNYIKVSGKPLVLVYRPRQLPDAKATAARWRDDFRSRSHGDLHLVAVRSFHDMTPPAEYGFDASVQFPPQLGTTPVTHVVPNKAASFEGAVYDYETTKKGFLAELFRAKASDHLYPAVMPCWDNTARRLAKANVWINSSPESYYDWLFQVVRHLQANKDSGQHLVFINAWNEWAEGCHLEPDKKHGHAWLNATSLALRGAPAHTSRFPEAPKAVRKAETEPRFQKRPLEVLFVSHDACPHGAQYSLLTLTRWLKENGLVNPRFIMAGTGALLDQFARVGPVLSLDRVAYQLALGEDERIRRLVQTFCGNRVAAVYLNSAASGHVAPLTHHLNVPQVAHVHELQTSIDRWVGAEQMEALRKHVDLFIAASGPVADNLIVNHAIPSARIRVVEEFIRCTGIREISDSEKRNCKLDLGLNAGAKIVLGCGTTDWRKGPDLFVEVAEQVLAGHHAPTEFVWVGGETSSGELKRLRGVITSKGLSEKVRFVGPVTNPFPYMLAADVFLLPSREDPFPLVCLEAADCGVPIICFADAGGMPDFVERDCGSIVPYLDVCRMADQVVSFLNDGDLRHRSGKRAREKVRGEFDVSVKGRQILELLQELCRDRLLVN
jgi:glycosyltransferase involved in cell wall biosynthesis